MKTLLKLGLLAGVASLALTSCKKEGCTDPAAVNYNPDAKKDNGTCQYEQPASNYGLTFNFTHNYDGVAVTSSDYDDIKYTNQFGNQHSITRLRYMISDVRLYKSGGDSVLIDGYHFVDLATPGTDTYMPSMKIPEGSYTGIAFNFGFSEANNTSNAYPDLNAVSWNWPMMLGGGYHYIQFEGKFIDTNTDTIGFAYHQGTARKIADNDTTYENNHFRAELANSGFNLSNNATVEIKMDLAEWFKNPNTWDLNQYHKMLMPNYNAQILMNQNGRSVFSVGTITQ